MFVVLSGEVNELMIQKLFDAYQRRKEDDVLTIYLCTQGGYVTDTSAIIHFINSKKSNIILIGYGELHSAGFDIFFKIECKKYLVLGTNGMVHLSWNSINIDESGNAKSENERFSLIEMKKSKQLSLQFFKNIGLTVSEINKIKKGFDLYLCYDRMLELLILQNAKKTIKRNIIRSREI